MFSVKSIIIVSHVIEKRSTVSKYVKKLLARAR